MCSTVLICILFFSCNRLIRNKLTKKNFTEIRSDSINSFDSFHWSNDTIFGVYTEKVALYLPVKLDILSQQVLFQLDLGASTSEIYSKTLDELYERESESLVHLRNVHFNINNSVYKIEKMIVNKKLGNNERIDNKLKLGNLGYDFFIDKILILDYSNSKFMITNYLQDNYYDDFTEINNVSINKFPILLETKLNGKKSKVMLDTGSSIIEFMTYPEKFDQLKGESIVVEKCCVKSFDKFYTLSEVKTSNELEIFNKRIPNLKVSTTNKFKEDKSAIFGMKLLRIDGITGNKFLLNNTIILDFKENKLWIK